MWIRLSLDWIEVCTGRVYFAYKLSGTGYSSVSSCVNVRRIVTPTVCAGRRFRAENSRFLQDGVDFEQMEEFQPATIGVRSSRDARSYTTKRCRVNLATPDHISAPVGTTTSRDWWDRRAILAHTGTAVDGFNPFDLDGSRFPYFSGEFCSLKL